MGNDIKQEKSQENTPVAEESKLSWWQRIKIKHWLPLGFWVLLIILGAVWVNLYPDFFNFKTGYANAYVLVNDKISQSAMIVVNVPPKLKKADIWGQVTIEPELKGEWKENLKNEKQIFFKPVAKMDLGKHFTVTASTTQGKIRKDFLVDEDPKVISVFPKSDSETHEKSKITITFNRPMVAMTVLDELADKDVPVEITPATNGKFKWISTRVLQFIPKDNLIASANYTVKVKSDFVSMDGLGIQEFEHKFNTRPLRYDSIDEAEIIFNHPLAIRFNQPVNLEKTTNEINIIASTSGEKIDFVTDYGKKSIFNKNLGKNEEIKDESIVYIYQKKDKFGREKFWDFNTDYKLHINKAYPAGGDIILEEASDVFFGVGEIISGISAKSDVSNYSGQKLFDPKGVLILNFYEDIALTKSEIRSDKLIKMEYGQKCQGDSSVIEIADDVDCPKIDDQKKILIYFDSAEVKIGEVLKLNLEKIINTNGVKLNTNTITKEINVYGELKIFQVWPDNNQKANLTSLIICSNNPLQVPDKNDYKKQLLGNLDFEVKSWNIPFLVTVNPDKADYHCQPGQYENTIAVGFMPESKYELSLKINDDFSQAVEKKISFHTDKMPNKYLNFYHYQDYYSVTTPDKTELTYSAQNMEYVDVHICKLSPIDMLTYLNNAPAYWVGPEAINGCIETATKKIDLPKKYWIKNYFHLDLKDFVKEPLGQYVVTISNPNYFDQNNQPKRVWERNYLTVTNLSVVEKHSEVWNDKNNPDNNLRQQDLEKTKDLFLVTEMRSLKPVVGAKISTYAKKNDEGDKKEFVKIGNYISGNNGTAIVPATNKMYSTIVEMGADSTLVNNNCNNNTNYCSSDKLNYASDAYNAQQIYLYTDKPIYQPGQTVFLKGLYRIGFDGNYEIYKDKKINLIAYSADNKEIWNTELEVNNFGTFNSEFKLDEGSPLGQYRVEGKNGGYAYFDVEEYKGSAFKLETKTDKDEYVSPEKVNIDLNANYYFGAPVEEGEVEYSITSQDYYFDKYQDEYFSFGRGWYECRDNCEYGDKFILRNKIKLDATGKARITQLLDVAKLFQKDEEKVSKIFTVYITVKNSSGQSVSGQVSFIMHAGGYYLGLQTDKSFLGKNSTFSIKVKSVDTNGKKLSIDDIDLKLEKINWIYAQRQEVDGGYYYQWDKRLEPVENKKISTDGNGNWSGNMSINKEGEYELSATGKDKLGNKIVTTYNLYVYGEAQVEVKPNNETTLDLVADKANLKVGDTASFIIKSPYKKAKALVTIERGLIYDYKIIDIDQNLFKYEFPIKDNYAPNIYASVVLLSPDPEVKFGSLSWQIDTEKQNIKIDVKSDKTSYLPGEEVTLRFITKDWQNKPIETEISAAVVDMSVLALKGNPKKDPLLFFYSGFPLTVSTISNLKNKLFVADVPIGAKGGGGNEPEDLARKKRGVFKETAFWQAVVKTDAKGEAETKFKLPDNLTTWQAESVGITRDTKLGVNYMEFMSRKNIMAVPLYPRFIIPGDDFYVGASVFNQTDKTQNLSVTLTSSTLTITDNIKQNISIKASSSKMIYFAVKAPSTMRQGEHIFTISVKNEQYEDTVEQTIPIRRNNTAEVVSLFDKSNNSSLNEYVYLPSSIEKDQGNLTINTSASLVSFVANGLDSVINYSYDANPDLIAKLKAAAIIKKGLSIGSVSDKFGLKEVWYRNSSLPIDKFVQIAQDQLYANYKQEGFTYYAGGVPDFYLSVDVLDTLIGLKEAGYKIQNDFFNELYKVINDRINYDKTLQNNPLQQILATYVLTKTNGPSPLNPTLVAKIKAMEKNEKFLNEDLGQMSLNYLGMLLTKTESIFGKNFKNKVIKILANRVNIDSRGAYVSPNNVFSWEYYETPILDTALTLKTLSQNKQEEEVVDRMMRWLDKSRDQEGSWGSITNTIAVIEAMTEYLNWQKDSNSDFSLNVSLNPAVQNTYNFNKGNWMDKFSMIVPISLLPLEALSTINFTKIENAGKNNFYYDIALKYYLPIEEIAPRDEGFTIIRNFYKRDDQNNAKTLSSAKVGDVIKGHLQIIVPKDSYFVAIEDFIPAGFELINFNLATADQSLQMDSNNINTSRDWEKEWYEANIKLWPDKIENRDDRLYAFKQFLPAGTYEYDYYLRALVPGIFHHLPAQVSQTYFPENFGRTSGDLFTIIK